MDSLAEQAVGEYFAEEICSRRLSTENAWLLLSETKQRIKKNIGIVLSMVLEDSTSFIENIAKEYFEFKRSNPNKENPYFDNFAFSVLISGRCTYLDPSLEKLLLDEIEQNCYYEKEKSKKEPDVKYNWLFREAKRSKALERLMNIFLNIHLPDEYEREFWDIGKYECDSEEEYEEHAEKINAKDRYVPHKEAIITLLGELADKSAMDILRQKWIELEKYIHSDRRYEEDKHMPEEDLAYFFKEALCRIDPNGMTEYYINSIKKGTYHNYVLSIIPFLVAFNYKWTIDRLFDYVAKPENEERDHALWDLSYIGGKGTARKLRSLLEQDYMQPLHEKIRETIAKINDPEKESVLAFFEGYKGYNFRFYPAFENCREKMDP
jgi:hypothetical protein